MSPKHAFVRWRLLAAILGLVAPTAAAATFRYEAETDFSHALGRPATGGWSADPGLDPAGYMLSGPGITVLHRGHAEARLRARTPAPTGNNDRVLRLEVVNRASGTLLASRDVRRHEFPGADVDRTFLLPFPASQGIVVDLNVYFHDIVPVTVDRVDAVTDERPLSRHGVCAHVPDAARVDLAAAAQLRWLRLDFDWISIEPQKGAYDWSVLDAAVDRARAQGQEVYATLAYTPDWATSGPPITHPPDDIGDWFNFVYWTVEHFDGRIRHWGIWNEPNLSKFWTGTRGDYINMMTIAAAAIRQADPDSFILGPELSDLTSSDWEGWLDDVLKYHRSTIDVVTQHIYDDDVPDIVNMLEGPRLPWEPRAIREIMDDNGMGDTPVWLTETGWTSTTHGEAGQAGKIQDLLLEMLPRPWWAKTFIYQLADPPSGGDTWGLLRSDLSPKLAYGATWDAALGGATEAWILAAPGPGPANPPVVTARTWDGLPAMALSAYGATSYGARVGSGRLDPSRRTLVLTGPGPGPVHGPQVRAFQDTGASVANVNFYAYGTLRYGVNVAGGDVDGDYLAEVITGGGPGAVFGPHVRGWNHDGAGIAPISAMNYFAYGTLRYGVNVATGSVDADFYREILTGPGPSAAFAGQVRGWNVDGVQVQPVPGLNFFSYSQGSYGCEVTAADLTGDGVAEPVTAPGPSPGLGPLVRTYRFASQSVTSYHDIVPFTGSLHGGRVAACEVDGGGAEELAMSAGPDPAWPNAPVVLVTVPPSGPSWPAGFAPFFPFPTYAYGVNLASLRFN